MTYTHMMEKQNCYLTNLFLTGSTTSGLTKDSRAPRSPAIILFVFCCQKKGKDVLLWAPKSMSTSTGNCSSGGAKATWRRQVTKRRSKANSVTLLSEKRSWIMIKDDITGELIVIVILCFWGHLFSRAGRPVERNCKIKVHSNLIHARLHLRGCG